MKTQTPSLWEKATASIPQCPKCIEWESRGYGRHCFQCETKIFDKFYSLFVNGAENETKKPSGNTEQAVS